MADRDSSEAKNGPEPAPFRRVVWLAAIQRLVLTAWIGSTWTIGLLAAPLAFSVIQPQSLAGTFASHIFYWQSVIALFCAPVILLVHSYTDRRLHWFQPLVLVVIMIAALAAVQQFLLAPIMAGARIELMSTVNEATRAALAARFGWLHGLSSMLYLIQCLLGAFLIVKSP